MTAFPPPPTKVQDSPPSLISRVRWFDNTGVRLLWAALKRFFGADGLRQGAAVAFYAAFSIAPLLVVVTGVMVWLIGSDQAQASLMEAATRLIGARETKTLFELLARRSHSAGEGDIALFGSWIALGTTLIGASGVIMELRSAVQAMLGEIDTGFSFRQFVRVRLVAIALVLGCGFMLSVAMVAQAISLIGLKWAAAHWPVLSATLTAVETLWSWAVMTLLFALMIRWLPDDRMPMRHAFAGAAMAGALFMVGRYGIGIYVATTATQSALGAAGSFAALLLWVYWSSQIFLFGAALSVEMRNLSLLASSNASG